MTDGLVTGFARWTGVTPTTLLAVTVVTLVKLQRMSLAVVVVAAITVVVAVTVVEDEVATEAAMTTGTAPGSPGTDRGLHPGGTGAADMAVVVAVMQGKETGSVPSVGTTTSVGEPHVTVVRRPNKEEVVVVVAAVDTVVVDTVVVVATDEGVAAAMKEVVAEALVEALVEKLKRGLAIGIVSRAGLTISLDAPRALSATNLEEANHKLCSNFLLSVNNVFNNMFLALSTAINNCDRSFLDDQTSNVYWIHA